jgi:hypothetical protein
MRAVWSFWAKPFRAHHHCVWMSPLHHLLAWVLSVQTVKAHYPDTALITDEEGARLLVDGLKLEFTTVSTELARLQGEDPDWWVLGKLCAYCSQTAPFIHFDNDVFLWKRLPPALEEAPVLAQNPEKFPLSDESWYRPLRYERAIRAVRGWVPEEWLWSTSHGHDTAVCCGILGGTAVEFLTYYAGLGIRMIRHPRNQAAWARIGSSVGDNILFEQYLLAACLEFHRQSDRSQFRDSRIRYLFDSSEQAFDELAAVRAGYTHLIGGAKSDAAISRRLAERVRREYPRHYENCLRMAERE